jgi:hypothetical protein
VACGGERTEKEREAAVPTLWKQRLRRTSRTLDPSILGPRRRDDVDGGNPEFIRRYGTVCAESLDREEAFKKRAAEEVASATTREQKLLAEIRSLRESAEAHADDEKAASDQAVAQRVAGILPEDVEHKISTTVKAEESPP